MAGKYIPTHDGACKALFDDAERADGIFRAGLPAEVAEQLDGLPERLDSALVGEDLAQRQLDICYRYRLVDDPAASVLLPLEHKLRWDRATPVQSLEHYRALMQRHGTTRRRQLVEVPPIIPVLLCNGKEGRAQPKLGSLVKGDGPAQRLARQLALEPQRLTWHTEDFTRADLQGYPEAWAGMATMTCGGRSRVSEAELAAILECLPFGSLYASQMLAYIMHNCERDWQMVRSVAHDILGNIGDATMLGFSNRWTTGGKAEMLTDLLRVKFGPLSAETEGRVANATPAKLKAWARAVLTANSPDEVFAARKAVRGRR